MALYIEMEGVIYMELMNLTNRAGLMFWEALGELNDMGLYVLSPKTIYMYACALYI